MAHRRVRGEEVERVEAHVAGLEAKGLLLLGALPAVNHKAARKM